MLAGAAGPGYVVGVIAQGGLARGCDTVPGDHGGATGVPPHAGPEGETCDCTNGSIDASPDGAPEATTARDAAAAPSAPEVLPVTAQVSAAPQATSRPGTPNDRRGVIKRRRLRNLGIFALLAGPNVLLLLVFVYRPLLLSFYYSLLQWNMGSPVARFVGLQNYVRWFTDPDTPQIMATTAIFAVATVGGALVLGLAMALLLNRKLWGRGVARTVAFAPYVLFVVSACMLWRHCNDFRVGF